MSALSLEEANSRYELLYDILNRGGGVDGVHTWEKNFVAGKLSHYQIARILKQNFSHNPTSFNDYASKLIPPDDLVAKAGST